jgi:PAS domain S-box-containing protein
VDITGRKQAENLLHAQAQEIKAIVENSPDLIVRFDRNLRRTYVNPAFVKASGLPKETLFGREIGSAARDGAVNATAEEVEVLERSLKSVMETVRPLQFEGTWPLQTGRRNFSVHLEPEFDAHGTLTSILVISRDITGLKEQERKLRQTEAELARVARVTMMGELAASIAHEVNQPLTAVVTNANAVTRWLAATPPNLDEAREGVRRIALDGTRASEVIRRIRALMKKSEPAIKPLNLNELIQETVSLTRSELKQRQVLLQTDLAPELPAVPADRVQLQQVLLNLVVNALDSMSAVADRPRILRIETDCPEPRAVHVSVQDTGVGIKPQETEHLYEPFYTTKPDGLGMGLAISRSIVEAHGGHLWVTPNDGHGVAFQFTLPVLDGGGS